MTGLEGSAGLIERARSNAALNGLAAGASFEVADLFVAGAAALDRYGPFDKLLIDPPREGAMGVVKALTRRMAAPDRLRFLRRGDARARRGGAGQHQGFHALGGRGGEHVSAHGAR